MKLKSETAAKKPTERSSVMAKRTWSLLQRKRKDKKASGTGRHKIRREVAENVSVHRQIDRTNEDQNVGTEALNKTTATAENTARTLHQSRYSKKLQKDVKKSAEETTSTKAVQKNYMKKEFQRAAYKKSQKEAANQVGSISKKFVDKAEDLVADLQNGFVKIMDNPLVIIMALVILILILMLSGSAGLAGGMLGSFSDTTIATSYTADDDDIKAVEQDYKSKESDLQTQVNNIPTTYPGYDEYRYDLAEINHNQYQLAALLTVLYEDYTEAEVQSKLLRF